MLAQLLQPFVYLLKWQCDALVRIQQALSWICAQPPPPRPPHDEAPHTSGCNQPSPRIGGHSPAAHLTPQAGVRDTGTPLYRAGSQGIPGFCWDASLPELRMAGALQRIRFPLLAKRRESGDKKKNRREALPLPQSSSLDGIRRVEQKSQPKIDPRRVMLQMVATEPRACWEFPDPTPCPLQEIIMAVYKSRRFSFCGRQASRDSPLHCRSHSVAAAD